MSVERKVCISKVFALSRCRIAFDGCSARPRSQPNQRRPIHWPLHTQLGARNNASDPMSGTYRPPSPTLPFCPAQRLTHPSHPPPTHRHLPISSFQTYQTNLYHNLITPTRRHMRPPATRPSTDPIHSHLPTVRHPVQPPQP